MTKILLHTCCGPCFLGSFEGLKDEGLEITNFFYNPNIWPEEEYLKRKEYLLNVTKKTKTSFIEGDYKPEEHAQAIKGEESEFPKRCLDCYQLRLKKTAQKAKDDGFDIFSTTLLISPYQQHDDLRRIGEEVAQETGVTFFYKDLRPYFKEGQELAKNSDIYRQKYCGCKYSKEYK
jgi:epoxyqueuosine reductase